MKRREQRSFNSTLDSSSCQFDPAGTTNKFRPQWTPSCFTEAYDPTTMSLDHISVDHGKSAQLNLQFAGAMAKRYHLGSQLATIEIGGKFRNAHKFDNTYSVRYDPADPNNPILLNQFANGFTNDNYYDNSYKLGYNPNYQTIRNFLLRESRAVHADAAAFGIDPANYGLGRKGRCGLLDEHDRFEQPRSLGGRRALREHQPHDLFLRQPDQQLERQRRPVRI